MFYLYIEMKKLVAIIILILLINCFVINVSAQCSICTKTAQQLGEKPAEGLNTGILYLMFTPFALVGVIGYRWWKNNKEVEEIG